MSRALVLRAVVPAIALAVSGSFEAHNETVVTTGFEHAQEERRGKRELGWTSLHLDVIARDRGLKRMASSLYDLGT